MPDRLASQFCANSELAEVEPPVQVRARRIRFTRIGSDFVPLLRVLASKQRV